MTDPPAGAPQIPFRPEYPIRTQRLLLRRMERAGLRREAHLVENEFVKGEWADELIYGILRREWEARQAPG